MTELKLESEKIVEQSTPRVCRTCKHVRWVEETLTRTGRVGKYTECHCGYPLPKLPHRVKVVFGGINRPWFRASDDTPCEMFRTPDEAKRAAQQWWAGRVRALIETEGA